MLCRDSLAGCVCSEDFTGQRGEAATYEISRESPMKRILVFAPCVLVLACAGLAQGDAVDFQDQMPSSATVAAGSMPSDTTAAGSTQASLRLAQRVPLGSPYSSHATHPRRIFEEIDKDADGQLSIWEARAGLAQGQLIEDTNGDGKLNVSELRKAQENLGRLADNVPSPDENAVVGKAEYERFITSSSTRTVR